MNAREWIDTRKPEAPVELLRHMVRFVNGGTADFADGRVDAAEYDSVEQRVTGEPLFDVLVGAGVASFGRVLGSGATSRNSALDLLSADAFVTYAFEAAADEPETIAARAVSAMRQVSELATAQLAQVTK